MFRNYVQASERMRTNRAADREHNENEKERKKEYNLKKKATSEGEPHALGTFSNKKYARPLIIFFTPYYLGTASEPAAKKPRDFGGVISDNQDNSDRGGAASSRAADDYPHPQSNSMEVDEGDNTNLQEHLRCPKGYPADDWARLPEKQKIAWLKDKKFSADIPRLRRRNSHRRCSRAAETAAAAEAEAAANNMQAGSSSSTPSLEDLLGENLSDSPLVQALKSEFKTLVSSTVAMAELDEILKNPTIGQEVDITTAMQSLRAYYLVEPVASSKAKNPRSNPASRAK